MSMSIEFLPESWSEVFDYLPEKDLQSVNLVCRLFHQLTAKALYLQHWGLKWRELPVKNWSRLTSQSHSLAKKIEAGNQFFQRISPYFRTTADFIAKENVLIYQHTNCFIEDPKITAWHLPSNRFLYEVEAKKIIDYRNGRLLYQFHPGDLTLYDGCRLKFLKGPRDHLCLMGGFVTAAKIVALFSKSWKVAEGPCTRFSFEVRTYDLQKDTLEILFSHTVYTDDADSEEDPDERLYQADPWNKHTYENNLKDLSYQSHEPQLAWSEELVAVFNLSPGKLWFKKWDEEMLSFDTSSAQKLHVMATTLLTSGYEGFTLWDTQGQTIKKDPKVKFLDVQAPYLFEFTGPSPDPMGADYTLSIFNLSKQVTAHFPTVCINLSNNKKLTDAVVFFEEVNALVYFESKEENERKALIAMIGNKKINSRAPFFYNVQRIGSTGPFLIVLKEDGQLGWIELYSTNPDRES